ncbi:uracil-DNA glycosylase [Paucibacter sp. APW11]|uniref:Type-4 uracil-DNA glycosylase n=1 Tax=Roseateles aquae TaxID=3077235 RepID=A0ABU3PAP7_9BURK|nr:uracil-DNA glycosylase [Paucibacter sp. APW11]MDT8999648.1 uracil-DNA glycosylase [Paucibacter sp. APW11]
MSWDERQRAMLEAMGIKLFVKPGIETAASEPVAPPAPVAAKRVATAASAPAAEPAHRQATPAAAVIERPQVPAPAAPSRSAPAIRAAEAAPMAAAPRALPADAGRIATLDWDALEQEVAGCQACGLCESRKQTVFGVGHRRAEWMIVGEAPGEQEDLQGEPFVGQAGKLLDNMLRALGLTRAEAPPAQQVFIANTLKCRPPRNRNPEPEELARCEPYLQRQIALVQPRIILAMGRFAVQSLLRSNEAIGKLRGRVHEYQGVPLIVTYHPAYLLRNLVDKARAWEDLCLAQQTWESHDRG